MKSHDLARLLLNFPDLPIAVHALNHTYLSAANQLSHGPIKVGMLNSYAGDHIVIGNISKKNINPPNYSISKMLHGEAPDEW